MKDKRGAVMKNTLTVNGKTAIVDYCDDSRISRLHFIVKQKNFEQYKDADGELGFAAAGGTPVTVTAHGETLATEVKSYTISAPYNEPFEVTVVFDVPPVNLRSVVPR